MVNDQIASAAARVENKSQTIKNPKVCPHCGVNSQMFNSDLNYSEGDGGGFINLSSFRHQRCLTCRQSTIFYSHSGWWKMIFPLIKHGPSPGPDMPDAVRKIYEEAQLVSALSPRSAAALLRLALQVLVDGLVNNSKSINDKIGALVQQGLDPTVQQAMDVLRVLGNEAAHAAEVRLDEDPEVIESLFKLPNIIVEQMISRPNHIKNMFDSLPASARAAIEKRDTTN